MSTDRKPSGDLADRQRRARVLAALGDPTRLGIVDLLAGQDLSPDALAGALDVPGNLLAHHLKVLQGAGLVRRVTSQHDRRRTYVQAVEDALDGLLPQLGTFTAPRVVFVCTHNSARSVLADALWRQASEVPSTSAGTHPADAVNPRAVAAAKREHLPLAGHAPQSIADVLRPDDLVVSVCDSVNEDLGDLPNAHLHWSVPDPATAGTDAAFTTAVDLLRDRVTHLAPRVAYRPATRTRTRTRKAHR